jgi:shikimate dehydrogenase
VATRDAALRAMHSAGFNCSLPYKAAVIQYLDGVGTAAQIMGAVNCLVRRGLSFIGEHTDGQGFLRALRDKVDPAGASAVMFGAGTPAVSVELALARLTRLEVVNRDPARGQTLVSLLNQQTPTRAEFIPGADVMPFPPMSILS